LLVTCGFSIRNRPLEFSNEVKKKLKRFFRSKKQDIELIGSVFVVFVLWFVMIKVSGIA
jgi:hypothetical protein